MVVDFHSHILPGVDDGSATVAESMALLRMEAEQGIRQVVATPHFYAKHDTPERFLARRCEAEKRLREALEKCPQLPSVIMGAEVYFFPGISDSEELSGLTIGGDRCILIEMPHPPWSARMYQELENIHVRRGLIPILAHIDRYIRPFKTYGIPEALEQMPVLVQANASFFLRPATVGMARRMLKADRIHLLGSDCHNLKDRPPNLGAAAERIEAGLGPEAICRINRYEKEMLNSL